MEFWLINYLVLFLQKVKICLCGALGHSKQSVINVSHKLFHSLMTRNIKFFEQKCCLTGSERFAESHQHFFVELLSHQVHRPSLCQTSLTLLIYLMKMIKELVWGFQDFPWAKHMVLLWINKLINTYCWGRSKPKACVRVTCKGSASQSLTGCYICSKSVSQASSTYANYLIDVD